MNKERRDRVEFLADQLEEIINEEQEAFDNIPENLQSSERAEAMEGAIDAMQTAFDELSSLINI